jgi:hypothetical protein
VIRHIVLFRWIDGATPEQVAAVHTGLAGLPAQVPSIRSYAHGPDLRLSDGPWDYAVVADFDDAEGRQAYLDHPAHDDVRRELIVPLAAERANVQIEL